MARRRQTVSARRTAGPLPMLVAVTASVAACATGGAGAQSGTHPPTALEAVALAPDAQRYAAVVAPFDAAARTFDAESASLPADASVNAFEAVANPFDDAVAAVDSRLRLGSWPAGARRDIGAQLRADQALRADLTGTLDVTLILAAWRHQVVSASHRAGRASEAVRVDLGLDPPPKG